MFHPFNENREDGNGVTRTYTVFDALSCSPNGVEVWKTLSDGTPTFTSITLTGIGKFADGTIAAPSIAFSSETSSGLYLAGANDIRFAEGASDQLRIASGSVILSAGGRIAWGSSGVTSADVGLFRDAANVLAQRNGTNAQAFKVYGTFTDASNYERLNINYSGSAYRIQGEHAGTGVSRNIIIQAPSSLVMRTSGSATEGWEIVAGVLRALTDNTYDIGAVGALRPRNVYIGTDLTVGGSYLGSAGVQAGGTSTFVWAGRSRLASPSSSIITLFNNGSTDFDRLQFGGTTASFPALKKSGTAIAVRLADDTADAGITAASITTSSTTLHTTSAALTNGAGAGAGTITNAPAAGNPTKWVPINDNGTTRYIPAW